MKVSVKMERSPTNDDERGWRDWMRLELLMRRMALDWEYFVWALPCAIRAYPQYSKLKDRFSTL